MTSNETLRDIEEKGAARMAGNLDQYWILSRRNRALLRRNESCVWELQPEDVEGCLNENYLRPAYGVLKEHSSKSTAQMSASRSANRRIVYNANGVRFLFEDYFG